MRLAFAAFSARPANGFRQAVLVAAAALVGLLSQGNSSAQAATEQQKEELALLYLVQSAPKICQWADAGDASKLDAKIEEAEAAVGFTDAEKSDLKAKAEEELRKPGNCDANGLARAMYDEAIK